MAQAVVDQLAVRVGAGVSLDQVWLVLAPPGVQQCVWDVVMLAAVSAMEAGRWYMAAALKAPDAVSPGVNLRDRTIRRGDLMVPFAGFRGRGPG